MRLIAYLETVWSEQGPTPMWRTYCLWWRGAARGPDECFLGTCGYWKILNIESNKIIRILKIFSNIFEVAPPVREVSPNASMHSGKRTLQAHFACISPANIIIELRLQNCKFSSLTVENSQCMFCVAKNANFISRAHCSQIHEKLLCQGKPSHYPEQGRGQISSVLGKTVQTSQYHK